MSNCSNHKKDLYGESDMKKVAEAIGDLHYETLWQLMMYTGNKLFKDGQRDQMNGKKKLGYSLIEAGNKLLSVSLELKNSYKISKPFMEDKK